MRVLVEPECSRTSQPLAEQVMSASENDSRGVVPGGIVGGETSIVPQVTHSAQATRLAEVVSQKRPTTIKVWVASDEQKEAAPFDVTEAIARLRRRHSF